MTPEVYTKIQRLMQEENVSFRKACSILGKRGGKNNTFKIKSKQKIEVSYQNNNYWWNKD